MSVLKEAEVAEKLAANQEEIQMHFGHGCVESASLLFQRVNHGGSSPACHHLWTSANRQQLQAHSQEQTQPSTF